MNENVFKTLKILMILFNILFLLAGIALLSIGLWIIFDYESFVGIFNITHLLFSYSAYIVVGVGGVTILLSMCGCIGAWKDSTCILGVFISILVIFLMTEVSALILCFFFTADLNQILEKATTASIKTQYGVSSVIGKTATEAWDFTQTAFSCCGYHNGSDYAESAYDATIDSTQPWPLTCCVPNSAGGYVDQVECLMSSSVSSATSNAAIGCFHYLKARITTYTVALASIVGGILILQILAVAFASCLISEVKRQRRVDVE